MKITVIGRGNVGGGLARRWEHAGHAVTALGQGGGDASDADVLVVAVPSGQIADALAGVAGLDGKVTIDATNVVRDRDERSLYVGGLETARMLEDTLGLLFRINQAGLGPFFYRCARPGEL